MDESLSGLRQSAGLVKARGRLDGGDRAVEELNDAGFKGVLGAYYREAIVLNELFEELRPVPEVIDRGANVGANCMLDEAVGVAGDGRVEQGLERRPNSIHDRAEITRALMAYGIVKTLEGGQNGTAAGVSKDDNKTGVESGSRELDAADLRGGDDVAGDTDDEEIPEALVEDEFGGDPRIGTTQDDSERLLGCCELDAASLAETGEEIGSA